MEEGATIAAHFRFAIFLSWKRAVSRPLSYRAVLRKHWLGEYFDRFDYYVSYSEKYRAKVIVETRLIENLTRYSIDGISNDPGLPSVQPYLCAGRGFPSFEKAKV